MDSLGLWVFLRAQLLVPAAGKPHLGGESRKRKVSTGPVFPVHRTALEISQDVLVEVVSITDAAYQGICP